MRDNPCSQCGACCAAFRVDFHHSERAQSETDESGVPPHLCVPVTPTLWRMRGTDELPQRCAALSGEIGVNVQCSIYPRRPSPCHEFAPYAALGWGEEACDRARRKHGLPPLSPTTLR